MEFLNKISPREYQKNILKTCIKKNCLVILPTGLGKTLIALMLTIERMKLFPKEKVLFLAPTKPLAEQHINYFKNNLPELFGDMQLFTGSVKPELRKKIWETADIIFSTPQCIANDLRNNLYNLENVSLLIEDEAHRCIKNYDYNYISQEYKKHSTHPRILGMTASPGHNLSRIKEICKNLFIEEVEIRTRESPDVKQYLQKLEFEKRFVEFPKEFDEIRNSIKKLFEKYIEELVSRKVLFGPATKTNLLETQKKIFTIVSNGNKNYNYLLAMSVCAQAIKIQHAIELLETQTLESFNKYLKELLEQAKNKKSKGVMKLISKSEFNFSLERSNELLSKNKEHPKLEKINEILIEEFKKNPDNKVIIFTQFRDTASIILRKINSLKNINAKLFIGQSKKGTNNGLSQKEQKEIIKKFSSGEINCLISTSIGEEGLDIPEVNLVIFYESVPSVIRTIQRSGRTARLKKGKLIVLITKNTRDESFFYVSRAKEKKMHKVMKNLKDSLLNNYEVQKKL